MNEALPEGLEKRMAPAVIRRAIIMALADTSPELRQQALADALTGMPEWIMPCYNDLLAMRPQVIAKHDRLMITDGSSGHCGVVGVVERVDKGDVTLRLPNDQKIMRSWGFCRA